jgi:poly-gamma-glutamate capsule biosynthesis protein CapA/YwtB (metallophosphatase superfamily)
MAISIDAKQIAEITQGQWIGEIDPEHHFSAVNVLPNSSSGILCITADNTQRWKNFDVNPPSKEKLLAEAKKGAKAFVVGKDFSYDLPYPVLKVENTWEALSKISAKNRDESCAIRILVTGSVGKTNYKLMAHHAFSPLTHIHANLSSANLNVPIWCSLASIGKEDNITIIEVSVANPNRGRLRSELIKPNILVFTNISSSHTRYHGSLENLIHAKAECVLSLQQGGFVLMSSDHPYFLQLKNEVQRLKPVPVLTWGKEDFCDAQLLTAEYDLNESCWNVCAKVMGQVINYKIGTHHSFAPISSLGILLTAAMTGLDVHKAAQQLISYIPGDTTGRIYDVSFGKEKGSGSFKLFDYSQRGSIEGFRAALTDLYRLAPLGRRIILALGESRDLAKDDEKKVHEEIASLIQVDRTAKVFTVGEGMKILRDFLLEKDSLSDNKSVSASRILASHKETQEELQEELLASIKEGDIVFIQGHHRVWMSKIVKAIEKRWALKLNLSPQFSHNKVVENKSLEKTSSFMAAGDMILIRDFPGRLIEEGSDWVFGTLAEDFQKADSFLVNLECVISQKGDYVPKIKEKRPFHYRAPQFVTQVLEKAGFSILCTSNNHSMDYGAEALNDQINLFEQMNIAHVGSGRNNDDSRQWVLQQCGDVKVAIIAFDTTAPWAKAADNKAGNFYLPCSIDSMPELLPIIKQARQYAHIVMVTVHWGTNWQEKPKPSTVAFAHAMIDAGVDAILGHSSHLLQGVELYQGCPIIYDMGTIISDRVSQGRIKDEAYFELKLSKKGIHELIITPMYLYRCRARRSKNSKKRILKLMSGLSAEMQTPLIEKEGTLILALIPDKQQRIINSVETHTKIRALDKKNIQYLSADDLKQYELATLQPEGKAIALGGGLEVGAYLHPVEISPGYAFVFEIRFRCLKKLKQRWRAEISFIDEHGKITTLRYPIADGSWHSAYSGSEKWFADRTLVRIPPSLKAGFYQLYWNLWTRDEESNLVYWQEIYPDKAKNSRGVDVGSLEISSSVNKGVAGVEWDKNLLFKDPIFAYLE